MDKTRVLIISNNKYISDDLVRELDRNFCDVDLATPEGYKKSGKAEALVEKKYGYFIYVDIPLDTKADDNLGNNFSRGYFNDSLRVAKNSLAKTIFIFPYYHSEKYSKEYIGIRNNILQDEDLFAAVIYAGEILKDKTLVTGDGPFQRLIKSLRGDSLIQIKDGKYYLPIDAETFAKTIVKILFSISSFGKATALLSTPVDNKRVMERAVKIYPGLKVELTESGIGIQKEIGVKVIEKSRPNVSINKVIDKLLHVPEFVGPLRLGMNEKKDGVYRRKGSSLLKKWKSKSDLAVTPKVQDMKEGVGKTLIQKKVKKPKKKKIGTRDRFSGISINRQLLKKRLWKLVILSIVLLIAPFLLLIINLIIFKSSLYIAKQGYLTNASKSIVLSEHLSKATEKYSSLFNKLPALAYTHSGIYGMVEYFSEEIKVAQKKILIKVELINGIDKLLSENTIDVDGLSDKLSLDIDYLIQDIDFFRSETKELSKTSEFIAKNLLGSQMFLDKGKLQYFSDIAENLPIALGTNGKTKYLVVLQNDAVSRASGGLVESVLLITFEKGRLKKIETFSVDELDRNLVGVVEPPSPLEDYFNKSSWNLRDANWFADFTNTAEQIEWFIDKELDEQVDGVAVVNYSFLKKVINVYGNLVIEEGFEISKENIDFVLNSRESEGNPDSRSRGDVSAIILKNMIEKTPMIKQKNRSNLLDILYKSLEEKEIQIFMHNNNLRRTLSDIGWDGSIMVDECLGNCYEDYVEIIESEPTESKSISTNKSVSLDVSIEEGVIKRNLVLFLENIGNTNTDTYKSYIRVLMPPDSGVGMIKFISENNKREIEPQVFGIKGSKEAGTFVEVEGGKTVAVVFSWESGTDLKTNENGEYGLKWIKQSGTDDYPIEVNLRVNVQNMSLSFTNLNLTDENRFGYNTNLTRDVVSRIFWKNGSTN